MSSESKKKRGESGVANARTMAFRGGGRSCNYSTKVGRTDRTNARWKHTVEFGLDIVMEKLGFKAPVTARLEQLYNTAR